MQAYCVKCRAKREMKDAKAITMKNGKPATQVFLANPSLLIGDCTLWSSVQFGSLSSADRLTAG